MSRIFNLQGLSFEKREESPCKAEINSKAVGLVLMKTEKLTVELLKKRIA